MNIGSNTASLMKIGTNTVDKIYQGSTEIYSAEITSFSLTHVTGIGGNFAGEPQGVGYDPTNDMFYGFSNNSGAREVKKINRAGTTLATNSNQGGSTNTIQDGCVHDGKVYSIRTPSGAPGVVQRFNLDLNYETEFSLPTGLNYGVALARHDGDWWITANSDGNAYRVSDDFSTILSTHDIATGNTFISSAHYSGLAWYVTSTQAFMWGVEHTSGGHIDIWEWDGTNLTLFQELSQGSFDLYNGIAIDETTNKLYGSSRNLSDDLQEYNITTS